MNDVTRDRSVKNHTQRSRHSWIGVIPPVDITREDTKTDPKTFRDTFRNSARNVASTEVTNETFRENKKKMIHYRIDPTPRSKTIFYKTKKATLCGFRPNWGRSNEKKIISRLIVKKNVKATIIPYTNITGDTENFT